MKKLLFLIFTVSVVSALVSSCKKDEDSAEKFSTLSVEENKATVENAGIDFVNVISRMSSISGIDVIINFGDLVSNAGSKGILLSKDSKILSTLETFVATAKGEKRVNDIFDAMVSAKDLSGDPESIQQFWDDNVGTYTWNVGLNDFDIALGGTKIIFKFPSTDVSSTNDATFTISNYTGVNISNPLDEDYTGDLPVALNADLKVGSETLMTYIFGASYNTDGVPNAIASDLTIDTYKFEIDITNNTTEVSVNYKFLENSTVIMDLGASGLGLFTEANYNANTTSEYDYTYYDYNPNTGNWDMTDFEEILNSANAHFQLFNIALRGDIDVKGLVDQIKIIDEADLGEPTTQNSNAAKINEFLNLRLVNVTNNEIMAKAEAYVVHDIGIGWEDYYIDFRLTFNDGSPIDMQTYFEAGFDDFVNELNSFIADLNIEHDLDIDPVDY